MQSLLQYPKPHQPNITRCPSTKMSTQHPIYGNPNRRTLVLPYAIYSRVPESTFTSALKAIEDNIDLVPSSRSFQDHPISDIITYHRSLCQTATPHNPPPLHPHPRQRRHPTMGRPNRKPRRPHRSHLESRVHAATTYL